MFSIQEFCGSQPQFSQQQKEIFLQFSRVKAYGPFFNSLLLCLIDIAYLSHLTEQKLFLYSDSLGDLASNLQQSSQTYQDEFKLEQKQFVTYLNDLVKVPNLLCMNEFYKRIHSINHFNGLMDQLSKQFLKDVGLKINTQMIKQLKAKIQNILKVPLTFMFYDAKKKQYIQLQNKSLEPKYIIILNYEQKLFLFIKNDDEKFCIPLILDMSQMKVSQKYIGSQTSSQLSQSSQRLSIKKEYQQFCAHCLLEFSDYAQFYICEKHGSCLGCYIESQRQKLECLYCQYV